MSNNKKYYYLKLKDNFFESDEMVVLESMPDGYIYSNILLKLYLRSLKNEGKLMFNDRIPFNAQMLARVTRHSIGDIEKAVDIFKQLGLIEVLDNGAIYISDIQNYIGTTSTEADRIREYRQRIAKDKKLGTDNSVQMYDKSTPEIEIEKEIELERDIEKEIKPVKPSSGKPDSIPYSKVIDYLNDKAGKNFKNVESNRKLIRARFHDGFMLDDFKKVIDTKTAEWQGTDMEQYLRPITLFGTKFEGYLNQKPVKSKQRQNFTQNNDQYSNLGW